MRIRPPLSRIAACAAVAFDGSPRAYYFQGVSAGAEARPAGGLGLPGPAAVRRPGSPGVAPNRHGGYLWRVMPPAPQLMAIVGASQSRISNHYTS